jgi:hypothetical protein
MYNSINPNILRNLFEKELFILRNKTKDVSSFKYSSLGPN